MFPFIHDHQLYWWESLGMAPGDSPAPPAGSPGSPNKGVELPNIMQVRRASRLVALAQASAPLRAEAFILKQEMNDTNMR